MLAHRNLQAAERQRQRRDARTDVGLCIGSGCSARTDGGTYCPACRALYATRMAAIRARARRKRDADAVLIAQAERAIRNRAVQDERRAAGLPLSRALEPVVPRKRIEEA